MSLISEGAKRPFRKEALTLDSYSDMSGACADGDHSTCKMVHVDVSDFCLCQEHDEHMSYPSQGVGLQDLASRKTAEGAQTFLVDLHIAFDVDASDADGAEEIVRAWVATTPLKIHGAHPLDYVVEAEEPEFWLASKTASRKTGGVGWYGQEYGETDYQGWTNPETWSVALWFNNEYDHYQATRGMTSASQIEEYAKRYYPASFTWAGENGFDFSVVNWGELIEDIQSI